MLGRCVWLMSLGLLACTGIGISVGASLASDDPGATIQEEITPLCIGWCPTGDHPFEIIWTRWGVPMVNELVYVTVGVGAHQRGPAFSFCDKDSSSFSARTDSTGRAVLRVRGGGVARGASVKIWVWSSDASTPRFVRSFEGGASFDQNGDHVVDEADLAIITSLYGVSPNLTADFDCDQEVSHLDIQTLRQHLGHTCSGVTRARTASWGQLKRIYR